MITLRDWPKKSCFFFFKPIESKIHTNCAWLQRILQLLVLSNLQLFEFFAVFGKFIFWSPYYVRTYSCADIGCFQPTSRDTNNNREFYNDCKNSRELIS